MTNAELDALVANGSAVDHTGDYLVPRQQMLDAITALRQERDALCEQKKKLQDALEQETALVIRYGDERDAAQAEADALRALLRDCKLLALAAIDPDGHHKSFAHTMPGRIDAALRREET